jgi:CDP-diglyceride synthetase
MNLSTLSDRGPGAKRSLASYIVVPLLFVLAYFGARGGIENVEPRSTAALLLALLPVPFFALLIFCYVRMVRGMDELARRIQLEGLAFAFPIALLIVFTAGLLDLAGFHGEQDWDLPRLWPLMLLPYWGGIALAQKRYQ